MVFGKRNGTNGNGGGNGAATATRPADPFTLPEYSHLSHNGAKLRVATPDIQWFKNNVSCQVACPPMWSMHPNAPAFTPTDRAGCMQRCFQAYLSCRRLHGC